VDSGSPYVVKSSFRADFVNVAVAAEALHVHVAVGKEIYFPMLAWDEDLDGDGFFPVVRNVVMELGRVEAFQESQQFVKPISGHLSNLPLVRSLRNV
jgi:hypothetical protein